MIPVVVCLRIKSVPVHVRAFYEEDHILTVPTLRSNLIALHMLVSIFPSSFAGTRPTFTLRALH